MGAGACAGVWSAAAGAATVTRATQRITRTMADTPYLACIIAQARAAARDKGLDYIGQTEHAVRAVPAAQPDMTASATLQAINGWQRG